MKINLQHILSTVALLTYGFTDSLTSAIMMELRGPYIEANSFISLIYMTQGFWGVVAFKLWAMSVFIVIIYCIQHYYGGKVYWKINGVLISISIFGILSTVANMKAIEGIPIIDPSMAILLYVIMVICSIYIGDYIDNYAEKKRHNEKGNDIRG